MRIKRRCRVGFSRGSTRRGRLRNGDLPDKPVTALRHGLDVLRPAIFVIQGAPDRRDVLRQVDLFDEGLRPQAFHQFVFGQQVPAVFDQQEESVKRFGRQGDGLIVTQKLALGRVQPERTELIEMLSFQHLRSLQKIPKFPSTFPKDIGNGLKLACGNDAGWPRRHSETWRFWLDASKVRPREQCVASSGPWRKYHEKHNYFCNGIDSCSADWRRCFRSRGGLV